MEELNKNRYKCAHEIVEEILQAIKNQRDISTCKKLLDFLQDDVPDNEFLDRIVSEELFLQYYGKLRKRDKESDARRLVDELNVRKMKKLRLRKLRITISSIAASVVMIVCCMWQFVTVNTEKIPEGRLPEQEFSCDKPTLILSNGLKLELQGEANQLPDGLDGIRNIDQNRVTYEGRDSVQELIYNTLIVPAGYTYNVELIDGSEVILNAGSRLRYPVAGNGEIREVELNGEAYFKVTKSSLPFIVKMSDSFVKVYGTEFNANNDGEGDMEVVLVKGRVGFKPECGDEVMLKPNQKCDYNSENREASVSDVDIREYVAWINDEFDYEQVPLDYFLKKVSAWYGVHFSYDKSKIEMIKFYVSTKRDIALSDLLLLIEKSTNLEFVRESEFKYTIK